MSKLLDRFGKPMAFSGYYQDGVGRERERRQIPVAIGGSRTTLTPTTRRAVLSIARYLHANSGAVRGAVADLTRYSIGSGLTPQSQATDKSLADAYEAVWTEWDKSADITEQRTFSQMQQLASLRMDVDGDVGFVLRSVDGFPKLQMVEGHAIGSDPTDEKWIDGVRLNANGAAESFSIISGRDEANGNFRFTTVPAFDFILLAETERVDQRRGLSSLAHALDHIRDLEDILSYEKIGVKMGAAVGVVVTKESGAIDEGASYIEGGSNASAGGSPLESFEAGMIPHLRIGEKMESFASNRPNPSFTGFIEHLLRDVSVGLGLPFEFIWDAAKLGGATQRFILAKAQRRFQQRQALLVSRLLNRLWVWVIASAIKRGDLPRSSGWKSVRWQAPAKITVDVGREANANRDDIKMGLRTIQEDSGERGVDWQELRDQAERETSDLIFRAQRVAKETGVDFQTVLYFMQGRAPNQPVNYNETEPTTV